jgi:hypothetical protein
MPTPAKLEVIGSIRLDRGADEIKQLAVSMDVAVQAVKAGDLRALIPMLERIAGIRSPPLVKAPHVMIKA